MTATPNISSLLVQDWANMATGEFGHTRQRRELRAFIPIAATLVKRALVESERGAEFNREQHDKKTAYLANIPQTAAEAARVRAVYQAATALGVARLGYQELSKMALDATRDGRSWLDLSQSLDEAHGLFFMPPRKDSRCPGGALAVQDRLLGTMAETRTVLHELAHAIAYGLGFVVQSVYINSINALVADEMIADLTAGIISQAIGSEVSVEIKGIVNNYLGGCLANAANDYREFRPFDHLYRGNFISLALTTTLAISEEMAKLLHRSTDITLTLPG